jgi:Protein of unknown function (DUF3048) N-terminal domain/Protein of unknown function (DUF3048) C-terminal domain
VTTQVKAAAVAASVLLVALGAFFLLGNRSSGGLPGLTGVFKPATCPLSGEEPSDEAVLNRPAIAVKIENNPLAYPLSGLDRAELVYEEMVEGGLTRFMAIYHCSDTAKAGPVRSSRTIDPAIMSPTTRLLAAAGGNAIVRKALDRGDVILIDESKAGSAMRRIPRPGITSEHTLYGNTSKLRKVGAKRFDDPPPSTFSFGDLQDGAKKASTVTITFSGAASITYDYSDGMWRRSQDGEAFLTSSGKQIAVDNVIVEEHKVNLSQTIVDVAGNPSIEIADPTGSGRAVLFRDGRAIRGRWVRKSLGDPVTFETRSGDEMVLHPGRTWIELVPSDKGEIKGSFTYAK